MSILNKYTQFQITYTGMIQYRYMKLQCDFFNKFINLAYTQKHSAIAAYNIKKLKMSTNSQINSTPETTFSNRRMPPNNLPDWTRLVWVDCEMTGLDTKIDTLLEVAVLVTDGDLNIVAEGPNIVIHHPEEVLTSMNEWCIQHHGKSGLTQMVRDSTIR